MTDSNALISLFLFAHQDDESSCFFEIHRLVSRGDKVVVAYLTSGTSNGVSFSARNAESLVVLKKLGVADDNIYFLGTNSKIPDGHLCSNLQIAYRSISDLIAKIGVPNNLYFHAWEGGHQDHDAVHLIGIALGKHLGILERSYQFPFYTGVNLPSFFFRIFLCLPENGTPEITVIPWRLRIRFIKLCFYYPSQLKTWIGLLPFFLGHYVFFGTQILQRVSITRIFHPPHSGKLLYERRGFYSRQRFEQETRDFIYRLAGEEISKI